LHLTNVVVRADGFTRRAAERARGRSTGRRPSGRPPGLGPCPRRDRPPRAV